MVPSSVPTFQIMSSILKSSLILCRLRVSLLLLECVWEHVLCSLQGSFSLKYNRHLFLYKLLSQKSDCFQGVSGTPFSPIEAAIVWHVKYVSWNTFCRCNYHMTWRVQPNSDKSEIVKAIRLRVSQLLVWDTAKVNIGCSIWASEQDNPGNNLERAKVHSTALWEQLKKKWDVVSSTESQNK